MVCSWVAMHTLPELARVPNAPPRVVLPVVGLRRVCLAGPLTLAVTSILLFQPAQAQKRRDAILQLRDDVSTAMAHATLTEKQTQKLDHCRQTLLLAAQSGRVHKTATKHDLDAAVKDIEKSLNLDPFQPDDRDLVRQDIAQLRTIERDQQVKRAQR
jgi:hypothetical protein